MWSKYGAPFDPRAELPKREYQAHLAIIEGEGKKRREESEEAESERRKADQQASRASRRY